ncbi:hypothetical protein BKA70DRAFT_1221645 [Coprinopsis sp. MPI-PUGE-AT-0042]|nr:hypothetical protein BKA70DRAFT_1221645 [Coprinopsis sp. MPI-PUGE-AT-0042]
MHYPEDRGLACPLSVCGSILKTWGVWGIQHSIDTRNYPLLTEPSAYQKLYFTARGSSGTVALDLKEGWEESLPKHLHSQGDQIEWKQVLLCLTTWPPSTNHTATALRSEEKELDILANVEDRLLWLVTKLKILCKADDLNLQSKVSFFFQKFQHQEQLTTTLSGFRMCISLNKLMVKTTVSYKKPLANICCFIVRGYLIIVVWKMKGSNRDQDSENPVLEATAAQMQLFHCLVEHLHHKSQDRKRDRVMVLVRDIIISLMKTPVSEKHRIAYLMKQVIAVYTE